jgi:hypothetical protein
MPTLTQAMAPWHEFYALLGGASATMVGLLFVAASVTAGVFSADRRAAQRMFLSASVVHFSSILAGSLIALAPIASWVLFGALVTAGGIFGLLYSGMAWRDGVRDGLTSRIDLEDRFWYAVLPAIGYLFETASGVALSARMDIGGAALALSLGVLLLAAIHNAWDITIWSITRRRE